MVTFVQGGAPVRHFGTRQTGITLNFGGLQINLPFSFSFGRQPATAGIPTIGAQGPIPKLPIGSNPQGSPIISYPAPPPAVATVPPPAPSPAAAPARPGSLAHFIPQNAFSGSPYLDEVLGKKWEDVLRLNPLRTSQNGNTHVALFGKDNPKYHQLFDQNGKLRTTITEGSHAGQTPIGIEQGKKGALIVKLVDPPSGNRPSVQGLRNP